MEDYIGKERIKQLAQALDDKIKTGWAEPFDGPAIKLILNALNDNLSDKVPENLRDELIGFIDGIIENDPKAISENLLDALKELCSEFVQDAVIAMSSNDGGQGPAEGDPD